MADIYIERDRDMGEDWGMKGETSMGFGQEGD